MAANWWDAAPLADGDGDWWQSAPLAESTMPAATKPEGMRGGKLDGAVTGARDAWDAGVQMLPRGLSWAASLGGNAPNPVSGFFDSEAQRMDKLVQGNEAEYQDARRAQGREGADLMRAGGNVAATLIPSVKAVQIASKLPLAGRVAASIPAGAALGVAQPVLNPGEDFAEAKAGQAKVGAMLGPAAELGGAAVSKLIAPKITDAARQLTDEGIRLTPGQMLGGWAKSLEDKATSWPIFGDAIQGARSRGLADLNVAVANRALAPIGQKVPKGIEPGRNLVSHVGETLGKEYDKVLVGVRVSPDRDLLDDLITIRKEADLLPEARAKQFANIIKDKVAVQFKKGGGTLDGGGFKEAQSEINRLARQYRSSQDAEQRALGELLDDVGTSLRGALVRSNPAKADALNAVNKGFANFVRMQRAAGMVGSEEGMFTASQLQSAVKTSDQSVRKGRFARGDALMQDLSDAAKSTMPSKVPDSGSIGRGLIAGGAAGYIEPNLLAGALTAASLYTRPGQYLTRNYLAGAIPGQNALALGLERGALTSVPAFLALTQPSGN